MTRQVESPWQALKRRLAERGTPLREIRLPPKPGERLRRGRRWFAFARAYRAAHPLCEACGDRLSAEVHHRTPIATAPERVFDPSNLVALCSRCHVHAHGSGRSEGA